MAQTAMTVRVDSEQKKVFDALCEEFGMSANTAINVFIRAVNRNRSIPFAIAGERPDPIREAGREAFEAMRAEAMTRPEITMEEINAEIDAVRRERAERKEQEELRRKAL